MGSGETVEGQITGEETAGGIQLIVYDPKEGQNLVHAIRPHEYISGGSWGPEEILTEFSESMLCCFEDASPSAEYLCPPQASVKSFSKSLASSKKARSRSARISVQSMGLGRGGEISQKIYPDPHGLKVWKEKPSVVDVVYMVSSEDFKQITGHEAPPTPVTYEAYQQHGLPWFELHDQNYKDSKGSDIFAKLKPVGEGKAKK